MIALRSETVKKAVLLAEFICLFLWLKVTFISKH